MCVCVRGSVCERGMCGKHVCVYKCERVSACAVCVSVCVSVWRVCSLVEISLKEPLSSSSLPQPLLHVDPVSGLLPSVPRDFQIFINLVDLCRSAKETLFPSLYAASYSKYCTVRMYNVCRTYS